MSRRPPRRSGGPRAATEGPLAPVARAGLAPADGAGPPPLPLLTGFESTYQPGHDRDVMETTGHLTRRLEDLRLVRECGVSMLRYPVRWHRVEEVPGRLDWRETDEAFAALADEGLVPIVDLVHHTSHPAWLTDGFADPRFGPAFLRYVEAFVERYPETQAYTLFNEPFSTLFLCGHEGIWPPHHRGMRSFVAMLENVLPAWGEAARRCRQALPGARHIHVDACERHTGSGAGLVYAEYANDRRFFVLDAFLGRLDDRDRPFCRDVLAHGGERLFELEPAPVDVVGLDYYAHCQWHFGPTRGQAPTPYPPPFSSLVQEYAERYERPVMVTETNIRGYATDRVSWLRHVVEQCEVARAAGVEVEGVCWFPFVDSCDWDSLLARCSGNVDPVGVVSLEPDGSRRRTLMTEAFALLAQGGRAEDLPAFHLQPPVRGWLEGFLPLVEHWEWDHPPAHEVRGGVPGDPEYDPLGTRWIA